MLRTIFLLGLMTATVSANLFNRQCQGSDGRCCTAKCPAGWKGYDGRCYYFSVEQSTFSESQRYCYDHQASLVTVSDSAESNFLKVQIATLVKGCRRSDSLLRKDSTIQLCYWRSEDEISQREAESYCKSYGGELVSVPDADTLEFINCGWPDETYDGLWTSITKDGSDWEDVNGNTQSYLPWNTADSEPTDDAGELCLRIRRNLFHDAPCQRNTYALCQIPRDRSTWIGVTDAQEEGEYRDLHGRDINSQDQEFESPEPNGGSDDDCVGYQLQGGEYSWGDFDCHEYNHFICESDPDCVI